MPIVLIEGTPVGFNNRPRRPAVAIIIDMTNGDVYQDTAKPQQPTREYSRPELPTPGLMINTYEITRTPNPVPEALRDIDVDDFLDDMEGTIGQ